MREPLMSARSSSNRSGFTLVELLIVIGVIVVLIALLLPSVASVRARARSVEAQSNLAQLGLALQAANRNRSTPVKATEGSRAWMEQIRPFLEGENNEALFVSPADPNAEQRKDDDIPSFAVNDQVHRMGSGDGNKIVMLDFEEEGLNGKEQDGVFEVTPDSNGDPWTPEVDGNWQSALDAAGQRQGGNVNVLRHDGSVSSESADDLITDHPAASADDWVPWRSENRWQPTPPEDNGDIDSDDDGIANDQDNCPNTYNPQQEDVDTNGTGDACEEEDDPDPSPPSGPEPAPTGCSPGTEVIVASPAVTGSFALAPSYKSGDAHNGDMYWTKEGNDGSAATFTTQITEPGEYRVYLWFDQRFDRSTQLSVTIQHADGNDEIVVDQTASTGEDWQYELGTYNFDDSGSVVLVNQMEKVNSWDQNYAVADAVKFECTAEGEALSGPNPCDPPTDPTGAVDRALEWLARQQQDDGSWTFDGSAGAFPSGATGLALLAFLGNGNTPFSGTYKQNVCDAVKFLIDSQDPADGSLETPGTEGLYAHLFAHWALAEALLLSQEAYDGDCAEGCDLTIAQIQAAAESATAFTVYADRSEGGWRYWPWNGDGSNHGDMSHAPWAISALLASKKAGLQAAMSDVQLNKLGNFINSHGISPVSDNSSGTSVATKYCYHTYHDPAYAPRPTVCGLVTRALLQKLSGSADHGAIPASHAAVQKFFEDNQPDLEGDLYYNKPGVWLAHMAGNGDWAGAMESYLTSTQDLSEGPDDGSWFFDDQFSKSGNQPRPSNEEGGRLYCTAMGVLCLEPGYAGLKILE